jgi:hypothetical protein
MGKGIDMARGIPGSALHADVIDNFKEQMLLVFLKRLKNKYGDDLVFPVAETDDTGGDILSFSIEDRSFRFVLSKKD